MIEQNIKQHFDIDLEKSVIGVVLRYPNRIHDVLENLTTEIFYDRRNQVIVSCMLKMAGASEFIELKSLMHTIEAEIKNNAKDYFPYLAIECLNAVKDDGVVVFERHVLFLKELFLKRKMIESSMNLIKKLNDGDDALEVLEEFERNITKLSTSVIVSEPENIKQLHDQYMTANRLKLEAKGISGVPCDIHEIDRITGGWQKSDMIVLAARPGMGKTGFILTAGRNAAVNHGMQVDIYSLEMSRKQMYERLVAIETREPLKNVRKGLEETKIRLVNSAMGRVIESNIFIDDTAALSIPQLKRKARKRKRENKTDLIIVDYLQLMQSGEKKLNREQEISTISRNLKELAKELDVPVIALSQLSRSVEQRGGDKIPMLSDLRESGAIEQDADVIGFLYRQEYYGITEDSEGKSTTGLAMMIFAKHRNGELGDAQFKFISHLTKFENDETFQFKTENSNGIAYGSGASEFENERTETF